MSKRISAKELAMLAKLVKAKNSSPDDEQVEASWDEQVTPQVVQALVRDARRHLKLRRSLLPLRVACDDLKEYVETSEVVTSDGVAKLEDPITDAAVAFCLGEEFLNQVDLALEGEGSD